MPIWVSRNAIAATRRRHKTFRMRVIQGHLHLLQELLDVGGIVVLLSDVRGFVFEVSGTENDTQHRRTLPIVPRSLPELVRESFKYEKSNIGNGLLICRGREVG